jgi:bifunctional non-homologous end joining protein LigD
MALREYRRKRDLSQTPEPAGGKAKAGKLIFVVQRHKASHLHYDFRLELDGVLKSWAVPKGPSMDPADKRLAMMVEDHPYDYKDFAGVIPEGNYGAGIVEVWDHGTYEPLSVPEGKTEVSVLRQELRKGSMKIRMKGRKLKGEFALVRMERAGENGWLLIKHNDRYAVKGYNSEKETPKRSPINKALAAEAAEKKKVKPTGKARPPKKGPAEKKVQKSAAPAAVPDRAAARRMHARSIGHARKVQAPIKPMLASPDVPAFDDADWLFEVKWDGYRAIAETGKKLRLYSRNGLSFLDAYPDVAEELRALKKEMVLDGEIVALDAAGKPDFQLLQHATNGPSAYLVYQVFDLLRQGGKDLMELPLLERKKRLRAALPEGTHVKYCEHVAERGKDFFAVAADQGLEGIIGKRKESLYQPGVRSKDWVKIKNLHTQEVVIGGFTAPRNSRKHFGALLLGVYNSEDEFQYVGHTGTGFDARTLQELAAAMKPLRRKTSPFAGKVPANQPATWVTPKLVANVKFTEWTREGHMRHPVFMGLRQDKDPHRVQREAVASHQPSANAKHPKGKKRIPATASPKEATKERKVKVGKKALQLTNLDKVFWPKEGLTKGDVVSYYERIAPYLLPYLKDRPQSLYRTPNGLKGPGFFQKDAGGAAPEWVQTLKVSSESRSASLDYILCNDLPTLMYLVNLGCIEINPWTSRKGHLLKPDHLVMDLDPSAKNTFDQVVEAALAVKVVLDRAGLKGYCKTSGSTGLHIYIPCGAEHTYKQLAPVALGIMRVVNHLLPTSTTLERSLSKRDPRKIYLDHLQNRKGQTLASVYSLRPRPGATVSTPLHWEEVAPGLDPKEFNIHNITERVEKVGDLFKPVLGNTSFDLARVKSALKNMED